MSVLRSHLARAALGLLVVGVLVVPPAAPAGAVSLVGSLPLTVGSQPAGIAIDPTTGRVFVADYGADSVAAP